MSKRKEKNKEQRAEKILWIFCFICFLVSGLLIFYMIAPGRFRSPEVLLKKYVNHIEKGEYERMYSILSKSSKSRIDKKDFVGRNKDIYESIKAEDMQLEVLNIQKKEQFVDIGYQISFQSIGGKIAFENQVTFVYDPVWGYGISWNENVIFPELNGNDKVVVTEQEAERGNIYDRKGNLLAGTDGTGTRIYPLGKAASHLTGYIQNVTAEDLQKHQGEWYTEKSKIGRVGAESLYEEKLRGKNGYTVSIYTFEGACKKVLASTEQKKGEDIYLTIDADLQRYLFEQFQEDKSCSAAVNPLTGEVLALVSTPSYDANDFTQGMSEETWNALNTDGRNPLQNRFRAAWVPGSVIKPIIASVGITSGKLDPQADLGSEGYSWKKDESWGDYTVTTLTAYENACLENAMIYSDNIYFAKAALAMGENILTDRLDRLGFNEKMPFDIWMTESQYSNSEGIQDEIQLADTGYGQGELLVNPLHAASMYTAFLNQGNMIAPYLILEENPRPEIWKQGVFSQEAADIVTDDMIKVIESPGGTGAGLRMEHVRLAGKTGTAEIKDSKEDQTGTELGWLAVLTPDREEDPVCIVTMVEDVKDRGGSHYVSEGIHNVLGMYYQEISP